MWSALGLISLFGGLGGLANALASDNGFLLPLRELTSGRPIIRPGFLGNIFMGALGSIISWGLYSAPSQGVLGLTQVPVGGPALAGAALVGFGGARWLSNEVDKRLLKATVSELAEAKGELHGKLLSASPAGALRLSRVAQEN